MDAKRPSSWLLTPHRGRKRRERLILFSVTIVSLLVYWRFYRKASLDLLQLLLPILSGKYLRDSSFFYTSSPHFAGQGLKQAQWTLKKWKEFGIPDSHIASYDAQLPAPTEQQRLALLRGSEVLYEAPLKDNDHGFLPAFYSFVSNANITASYVFANFGADEDYDDLVENNIRVAQNWGLVGVLLYPDPQNDYPITELNGYSPYPKGPARPAKMIERGDIGPFVSYADAIPILTALNGYGPSASELGTRWQGGELAIHGVRYNVGPSPETYLHIVTDAYIQSGQVHNVIGKIPRVLENDGQSVLDVWNATGTGIIGTPGGGDVIRFQGLLCASTIDFGFSQGLGDNVFPYHSGFDSFEWIIQYGDPGWEYHLTTTKLWLVMAAHLSELPILDMKTTDYADAIER
ncbi:hypothetical protein N7478_002555 [Penicillium angulare]|uniref:uncharacterized protein n=1 Tax=Penicillium angulare TaxID=116970 RepID=UPI0025424EC5|nr:uncharacterized protein N7478_002555 [Penicillium angulare]KAJ5286869.1 hypothetical protein N7478_002555 [Penicillium angulare]